MASASANSFSAAFDTISNRQRGAKGEIEEASSGSVRVDTFSKLVQNSSWEEVRKMMDDMSREFEQLKSNNLVAAKEYFTEIWSSYGHSSVILIVRVKEIRFQVIIIFFV